MLENFCERLNAINFSNKETLPPKTSSGVKLDLKRIFKLKNNKSSNIKYHTHYKRNGKVDSYGLSIKFMNVPSEYILNLDSNIQDQDLLTLAKDLVETFNKSYTNAITTVDIYLQSKDKSEDFANHNIECIVFISVNKNKYKITNIYY